MAGFLLVSVFLLGLALPASVGGVVFALATTARLPGAAAARAALARRPLAAVAEYSYEIYLIHPYVMLGLYHVLPPPSAWVWAPVGGALSQAAAAACIAAYTAALLAASLVAAVGLRAWVTAAERAVGWVVAWCGGGGRWRGMSSKARQA